MDIKSVIPDIMPHYIPVGNVMLLQSLIAGFIGTGLFVVFIVAYVFYKKRHPYSYFVQIVKHIYEFIHGFLAEIGWENVDKNVVIFSSTIFMYVLRHNIIGLLGDMIVLVRPAAHHVFRPVTTDIYFNAILACVTVFGSIGYWFYVNGWSFLAKYFPHNGMGIVGKVDKRYMIIPKFLDILLWLLIWFIELIGEFGRIMSLSLRLFWNMFVGMILLWLLVVASQYLLRHPIILPVFMFAYELCVALLQAFIFALLTTVYFKLSADHHT